MLHLIHNFRPLLPLHSDLIAASLGPRGNTFWPSWPHFSALVAILSGILSGIAGRYGSVQQVIYRISSGPLWPVHLFQPLWPVHNNFWPIMASSIIIILRPLWPVLKQLPAIVPVHVPVSKPVHFLAASCRISGPLRASSLAYVPALRRLEAGSRFRAFSCFLRLSLSQPFLPLLVIFGVLLGFTSPYGLVPWLFICHTQSIIISGLRGHSSQLSFRRTK